MSSARKTSLRYMLYGTDRHGESAKLFLNKRDIINLQVRFLDQKSSNEANLLFSSKWDENGITDAQMAAKSCLPATLKNKCNWSLCSAAWVRRETKANCHKNYVQLPNSTANRTTGREIQAVNSRKAELWDWRPIYCLLCPRGRGRCQCSEMLVPQFPLMGGRKVQVLHWIKPPASSSTLMYNLATTVNCATYTVSGADSYCPWLAFCIRQHMWCIYWHRWGCVQQKVWVDAVQWGAGCCKGTVGGCSCCSKLWVQTGPTPHQPGGLPHSSKQPCFWQQRAFFCSDSSSYSRENNKQMQSKQKLKFHTSSEPICFKV